LAFLCPLVVLPLGFVGYFTTLRDRPGRWLVGTVLLYFTATGLLAADLLADEDPLVRELAFTTAVCKHGGPGDQYRYLKDMQESGEITPHFWRAFVLLRRKIGVVVGGSSGRLRLRELDWWLDAVAERPLPAGEVLDHIRRNP
jgi:hypothetical protein